jgi:anaerobic ribonucleoside-triphosphate reductase activating protein
VNLHVYAVVERTTAEGPGHRMAAWVQGCTIRCPGCFNAHLWPSAGAEAPTTPVEQFIDRTLSITDIEGVTLLGGEPFDQAASLARYAAAIRGAGLTVMTFTGHRYEDLLSAADPAALALLSATDLLVDGPFVADMPDTARPWVGSTNQRFIPLTERYADIVERLAGVDDQLEIRVRPDGSVFVSGQAQAGLLRDLRRTIRAP